MTTIAYDGKTLAVDSKVTSSNLNFGTLKKVTVLQDGRLLAGAGDISVLPEIATWLNGGEKPDLRDSETYQGLIVSQDGTAQEISSTLRIFPACIPWAGGSGEVVALTAMYCGKTAEEAVEIACKLDCNSGLPVTIYHIHEMFSKIKGKKK